MKQIFILFIAITAIFQISVLPVNAKAKKLTAEELAVVEKDMDTLTKKVYASTLFTPEDADLLIESKLKLNNAIDAGLKDTVYAKLFFNLGYICKKRDQNQDAIQYFLVVKKYFSESMYAKKAQNELKHLGVNSDSEEESEE